MRNPFLQLVTHSLVKRQYQHAHLIVVEICLYSKALLKKEKDSVRNRRDINEE